MAETGDADKDVLDRLRAAAAAAASAVLSPTKSSSVIGSDVNLARELAPSETVSVLDSVFHGRRVSVAASVAGSVAPSPRTSPWFTGARGSIGSADNHLGIDLKGDPLSSDSWNGTITATAPPDSTQCAADCSR